MDFCSRSEPCQLQSSLRRGHKTRISSAAVRTVRACDALPGPSQTNEVCSVQRIIRASPGRSARHRGRFAPSGAVPIRSAAASGAPQSTDVRTGDARRFPDDFRARRSPTLNITADIVSSWIKLGKRKRDDPWEIAMEFWAHVHGYLALWRAGRFHLSEDEFRKLVHRSLRRLLNGLAR